MIQFLIKSNRCFQEPMSRSLQLPYWVTAFLQTDLFLVHLFFCERKAVRVQWGSDVNWCFVIGYRARNNGRSTDNVRNDCGFDRSNFRLAGHVDRSKFSPIENEINLRVLLFSFFSCYLSSRCVLRNFDMKSWWHTTRAVVYNSRIETDIGIRPLPVTLSNDSWEINS